MDDADRTADRIEVEMEARLRARASRPKLLPCGHCHWCNEDVGPGKLFCASECRDDFDTEHARLARLSAG